MSSEAKTQANRENAKLSTGPQTEEGKKRSSQNARQHGLTGRALFIPEDRQGEFKSLYDAHWQEVRPVGEIQAQYFEQMIHAAWYVVIARELLANAYEQVDERKVLNFTRLLGQHERAYARAHKTLVQLQTDLALRTIEQNEPIAGLPMTVQVKAVTNEATRLANLHERTQRPAERHAILTRIGNAFCLPPQSAGPAPAADDTPADLAA
jgi:hypothetical protein